MFKTAPPLRCTPLNAAPVRPERACVIYWMIAARRTRYSFALEHALALASTLQRPLLVLEPLRAGYRWASDRLHRFILDGMAEQRRAFAQAGLAYYPYVEPTPGEGAGLLQALGAHACAVVTDDFPCSFLPRMVRAAADQLDVRLEMIDGNGLLPLREPQRDFTVAHSFRRHLQKHLLDHLLEPPREQPLQALENPPPPFAIPEPITRRWPPAGDDLLLDRSPAALQRLAIDHSVPIVHAAPGGQGEALRRLAVFLARGLPRYAEDRDNPDDPPTSGLSPWLHFGHISAHEIVLAVLRAEAWTPNQLAPKAHGSREGWWNLSPNAEAFLDQIITWREVGFQNTHRNPDSYDTWEGVPAWARLSLTEHADDPRPELYTLDELDQARTHDPLWNAAQRQLRAEGVIHNYLRMLWGKKVLEWSPTPQEALQRLLHLNNRYALDGRDPNSISGILWCLGLFDRAWGPEREIFGKIRYMASNSTARKLPLRAYLQRWSG